MVSAHWTDPGVKVESVRRSGSPLKKNGQAEGGGENESSHARKKSPPLVRFSSVESFGRLGRVGDIRGDSVDIVFQSLLLKATVSSSGLQDGQSLL